MRTLSLAFALIISSATLTVSAATAFAQAADADVESPTFATTDRQDGTSRYGVDLGFSVYDEDDLGFAVDYGMRFDLYGQYLTGTEGARVGGYASVALSRIETDGPTDSEITNLEVGGIYVVKASNTDVVLHGGLTLPTAGDGLASLITNSLAGRGRLTDTASILPDTIWLRLGASPMLRSGNVFLRFDLGVDIPIDEDEDNFDVDPLARINAAAGLVAGSTTVLGELVTIFDLGDDNDDDEDYFHTLALGARFRNNTPVQPIVSAVIPLDETVRDGLPIVLMVGVQYTPIP